MSILFEPAGRSASLQALEPTLPIPVATATGADRRGCSFEPRGLAAPAGLMPPPGAGVAGKPPVYCSIRISQLISSGP